MQVDILEEVGIIIEDESLVNSIAEENGQNILMGMIELLQGIKIWWCISFRGPTCIIGHTYDIYETPFWMVWIVTQPQFMRYTIFCAKRGRKHPIRSMKTMGCPLPKNGQKKDPSNIWCYSCNHMGHYMN